MSWLSDFVSNPVQTVAAPVQKAVETVTAPVAKVVSDASKGDVGKFVSQVAGDTGRVLASPFEVASDLSRGDIQHAQQSATKGFGSSADLVLGGMNPGGGYILQQNPSLLSSKELDKYTLGMSSDYAGTLSGARSAADSGQVSSGDQNSIMRWLAKVGLIGASVSAAPKIKAYFSQTKSAEAADAAAKSTPWSEIGKDTLLYGGIAKAVSTGNIQGAINQYTGAGNDSPVPDWLKTMLPTGNSDSGSGNYGSGGVSGRAPASSSNAGTSLVTAGLLIGALVLAKKSRVF